MKNESSVMDIDDGGLASGVWLVMKAVFKDKYLHCSVKN